VCIIYSSRWDQRVWYNLHNVGRNIVVGMTTRYGLDGPGIGSRWRRDFPKLPDWPWGPPCLLYSGYQFIPRGKVAGVWLDHSPHLAPRLKNCTAILVLPLWAFVTCYMGLLPVPIFYNLHCTFSFRYRTYSWMRILLSPRSSRGSLLKPEARLPSRKVVMYILAKLYIICLPYPLEYYSAH